MRKRLQNLFFILTMTMTALTAQENQPTPQQLGPIQATTKVHGKIYTFFAEWVKVQNGNMHSSAEFKRAEEIFLGAKPAGQKFKVDAALYYGGSRVYLFEGEQSLAFDMHPTQEGVFQYNQRDSRSMVELFDLPPYWTHVDAAIRYDAYTIFFFHGPGLLVYNLGSKRTGEELVIHRFEHTRLLGKVQIGAAFRDSGQHTVFVPKAAPDSANSTLGR